MAYIKDANIEIHAHPFLRKGMNRLEDVILTMENNGLDILALESFNYSLYPHVREGLDDIYPNHKFIEDESGVILPTGKVILNAREYNTKEDFHILTVGCEFDDVTVETPIEEIIERGIGKDALIVLDHPFVENARTRTAGHISREQEVFLEELCKKYSGKVALEWNGYCVPWIRLGLMLPLALGGHDTRYHDVNKKVKQLSEKLKRHEPEYNVPVVSDTDLHARDRWLLKEMGKARFITDVYGETPSEMVSSIKRNIFAGEYRNNERYASSMHLLYGFCIPILFPKLFYKPRA